MPEWNTELYKFIDEPRHVENSVVFSDRDEVVILRIVFSKLCHQMVVALYGLLHVFQAEIARNDDKAVCVKI